MSTVDGPISDIFGRRTGFKVVEFLMLFEPTGPATAGDDTAGLIWLLDPLRQEILWNLRYLQR